MNRVISVRSKSDGAKTFVTVLGDGNIPEYLDRTFADPPRIVIDLLCASQGFETQSIALDGAIIDRVRVGHHPDRIRIVLDVTSLPLPAFSLRRDMHSLHIALSHDRPLEPERTQRELLDPPEKAPPSPLDGGTEQRAAEALPSPDPGEGSDGREAIWSDEFRQKELLDIASLDGLPDALLLQEGIEAFREEQWMDAVERFRALLEKHPQGRYEEKASFLLAKSYERLTEPSLSAHFAAVRSGYESFLSRFPSSQYGAEALAALGSLCFRVGYYSEAMGYYGLALSRGGRSPAAAEALEGQMRIHVIKRRFDEALSASRRFLDHYPGGPKAADVRLERARILHRLNRFQESLSVLSVLQREGALSAYIRPEISLYLGYNGYQLGDFQMARENLLRFCNLSPLSDEAPIALTKIGDSYRYEKDVDAAGKFYRLVAEEYPGTEAALISQIRLAELQEQGQETALEKGLGFGADPGGKILSPREVYETMLQNAGPKEAKNPLIALALMKLALFYQKEGEYAKSLSMVKELMERFPGQHLQKETEHLLFKALEGNLAGSIAADQYSGAVGFYYEEKELFFKVDSPELYLAVARAFLKINLRDDATTLFKRAASVLLDDEKPSDLLYFLALDLYRQQRPDEALDKLRAAVGKGGESEAVSEAYRLTAKIMAEQGQWSKALESLGLALKPVSDPCMGHEILIETSAVQAAGGMHGAALDTARKADKLRAECGRPSLVAQENLARVFSLLGRLDEAVAVLEGFREKEGSEKGRERIFWRLAQTYEIQGKREDALALYRNLADLEDSVWRGLAREKIEEIRFRQEMDSLKKK
jgi:TolA-binding protein